MFVRAVVVCLDNICRSPMARALLRARLGHRPRFDVSSAGVSAILLMKERGIDDYQGAFWPPAIRKVHG